LSTSIDQDTAIKHLNTYGKPPAPLFAQNEDKRTAQLILLLQGVDEQIGAQIKKALRADEPAFLVSDPPSYTANDVLIKDLAAVGVPELAKSCSMDAVANPFDETCWKTTAAVARYDLQKVCCTTPVETLASHANHPQQPRFIQDLIEAIPKLLKAAKSGDLEAAILLHPESARSSPLTSWTTSPPTDLRRRAAAFEEPMADDDGVPIAKPTSTTKRPPVAHPALAARPIPTCFQSYNSCVAATNNCTGHGLCANRGGNHTGSAAGSSCFACRCLATVDETTAVRRTTHWGGNVCQKEDVSTPFWLLAGFTIAITWAIAMAIGMLYSVGEEKLPGVIGAGVSRTR
jgi:hypothetical protein